MKEHNYTKAHYSVSVMLTKPIGYVFDHIIDLSQWWPEDFSGEKIKLDSEFVLSSGDTHFSKNKVIEFVPNRKLAWLTTESIRKTDNYDWSGTKMIFELTPFDDDTLLKFTYDGVVLEDESDRLIQICDMTIKDLLYNFIINGRKK